MKKRNSQLFTFALITSFLLGLAIIIAGACLIAPAYSGPIVMEPSYSAGTAALPSLKIIGDEDTGLWSPAANTLAMSTGGVEAIRWNSSQQTLHADGSAALPSVSFASATGVGLFRTSTESAFAPQSNLFHFRAGIAAQAVRVYNTFTDASNGEWFEVNWTLASNIVSLRTAANGTGAARTLDIPYGNTTTAAIRIPSAATGTIILANTGTAGAGLTRVNIGNSGNHTAASGTNTWTNVSGGANPTASSTMIHRSLTLSPTINYAGGGAGSYEISYIAVTETALPSGKNYLARWLAGSAGNQDIFAVTNTSHIETGQATAPALSACGTAPAIVGTDANGKVTIGTGVTTSCTVTFDTAYTNAPPCMVSGDNTAVTYVATTSTTVLTIASSADMASDVVGYICMGRV